MVACTDRPRLCTVVGLAFVPFYLLSGVIFPLNSVPREWLDWLLLNPLVHLVDLMRQGFAAGYPPLAGTEIGIRMAVGAKTWDIRLQFIIEAITLSLIGGIVGIVIGISVSKVLATTAGWAVIVSPFSVMISFGFSALVGVFFGFYPAYKASLLDPIEALRYE